MNADDLDVLAQILGTHAGAAIAQDLIGKGDHPERLRVDDIRGEHAAAAISHGIKPGSPEWETFIREAKATYAQFAHKSPQPRSPTHDPENRS